MSVILILPIGGCALNNNEIFVKYSKHTDTMNGVTLNVLLPTNASVGDPLIVTIKATNESNTDVKWTSMNGILDVHPVVTDASGQLVEKTSAGQDWIEEDSTRRLITIPLHPGDSKYWTFDIAKYFILKPGNYELQIKPEFNLPNSFRVLVRTTFIIDPK